MTPEVRQELRSLIYDDEGVMHEDVQREVVAAVKRYPNSDAEWWLGGVAATTVVMRRLGLYHDSE